MLALNFTFPETFPKVETFPLLLSDLRNLTKGNGPSLALRLSSSPANTLSDLQDPRATMWENGAFLSSEGSCFIVWITRRKQVF